MTENNSYLQPDDTLSKRTGKRMRRRVSIWVSLFLLVMVLGLGGIKLLPAQNMQAHAAGACASLESSVAALENSVYALNSRANSDIPQINVAQPGTAAFIAATDLDQYISDYGTYYYPNRSADYASLISGLCPPENFVRITIIRSDLYSLNSTLKTINTNLSNNTAQIQAILNSFPGCPAGSNNCQVVTPPAPDDTINYDLCVPHGNFATTMPDGSNNLLAAQGQMAGHSNPLIATQAAPEIIYLQRHLYPESASHIEDAIAAGYPAVLTLDRWGPGADSAAADRCHARRQVSTSNYTNNGGQSPAGTDRDEYPFASTREGGDGTQGNGNGRIASVRAISASDNRGFGSVLGAETRWFPNETQIQIVIIP